MTTSLLQDSLKKIHDSGKDWVEMSFEADRVRSHAWFKNMTEKGAWGQFGATKSNRVGPPDPDTFTGLAKLLGTTVEAVASMVASDFYGVTGEARHSARVQRIAPMIESLKDDDADLVELLVGRLNAG